MASTGRSKMIRIIARGVEVAFFWIKEQSPHVLVPRSSWS